MSEHLSRREFLQTTAAVAGAPALSGRLAKAALTAKQLPFRGPLCFFSKPVPQLSWPELAEGAKSAGFDGVDLTVRAGGHVRPERVTIDLPQAVKAIRAFGLQVPMITTELLRADDPTAEPILSAASELSIPFLKPGYYQYRFVNVLAELAEAGEKFRALVELQEGTVSRWDIITTTATSARPPGTWRE